MGSSMTAFRQSEAWLAARRAESEARKRAADGLKRPESDPKPAQASCALPFDLLGDIGLTPTDGAYATIDQTGADNQGCPMKEAHDRFLP